MEKIVQTIVLFFIFNNVFAQPNFGIGTDNANASLEIQSSNPVAPLNTEGILITRVDNFPSTQPTALQDGMLIFVTGSGTPARGFYYWDNGSSTWITISNTSNWIDNGTYLSPADGNSEDVAIGGNDNPNARLTVRSDKPIVALFTNTTPTNNNVAGLNTYINNNSTNAGSLTIGNYNDVHNQGVGHLYGDYNNVRGVGNGNHHGVGNILGDAGNGVQTGVYTAISNSGNGIHYGVRNTLNGIGTGDHYGILNELSGTGTGQQIGIQNFINNSNNSIHKGTNNLIMGLGNGDKYGTYNSVSGAGTGDKYGTYNFIESASGGTHYGVYSNVQSMSSYAGYFLGNVAIGTNASNTYQFPAIRGTNQDIMISDNAGNLSWQNINDFGFWSQSGNAVDATAFIGTVTHHSLKMRVNNIERLRLGDYGLIFQNVNDNVSIGSTNPAGYLGSDNIMIGEYAAFGNITGTNNIAIGTQAIQDNTSGSYNISLGTYSLNSNQTGSDNVAIGHRALEDNMSGNYNIALGSNALNNGQSKTSNVAIGYNTGRFVTDGSFNTLIGHEVAENIARGSNNTLIGNRAGSNISNIAPHNNNIVIGSNIDCPIIGSYSNNLSIGNIIYGSDVDGYDDVISTGNIGIGIDNPIEKLDVAGNIKFGGNAGYTAVLKNSDGYNHSADNNLDFGNPNDAWTLASMETKGETAGIHGNQDYVVVWSAADFGYLIRFLDEDYWSDNDGNPYDNNAERAYIDQNGQYFQVSDSLTKKNISKIDNALNTISKINGYQYQFKSDSKNQPSKPTSGLLAQELKTAYPEAVQTNEYNEHFVNYSAMVPLLIEALKEQQTQIDELKKELIKSNK